MLYNKKTILSQSHNETFCGLKGSRTHMENPSRSMVKQTKKSLDVEFVDVTIYDSSSPLSHGIY